MLFDVLYMSLGKSEKVEFRADRYLFCTDLRVIVAFLVDLLQFDLMKLVQVAVIVARRIVREYVQRRKAGMKALLAKRCLVRLVGLAFFVLETEASHVWIKSFIRSHTTTPPK